MALPRLTPRRYAAVTRVALVLIGGIIVTGAAVRLSGSGLGCPDWPNCDDGRLVAPLEYHALVEFVNRTITGLVSIAVIVAVLGSLVRTPRRRDLTWLSLGLVAGVVGQIVLGGVTVLVDLHPAAVQAHFLLSMVILADAVVLHRRAGEDDGPLASIVPERLRQAIWALVALAAIAVSTGTVVTGTGPHGGDEKAKRFAFAIETVSRVHGITVMILLAATLLVYNQARRAPGWDRLERPFNDLVLVIFVQGAIGYTQYFMGVPAGLVLAHVLGATLLWVVVLRLALACRAPAVAPEATAAEAVSSRA